MSLTNVWVQTAADGLVRADQVVGIGAHQTPTLSGKPARWLLDVVLPVSIGSGCTRDGWAITAVHRTLIQTAEDPTGDTPLALARLLAQLDLGNAAGVIPTSHEEDAGSPSGARDALATGSVRVRFRFAAFPSQTLGRQLVDDAVAQPNGDRPIGHQVVNQAMGMMQAQLGISIAACSSFQRRRSVAFTDSPHSEDPTDPGGSAATVERTSDD